MALVDLPIWLESCHAASRPHLRHSAAIRTLENGGVSFKTGHEHKITDRCQLYHVYVRDFEDIQIYDLIAEVPVDPPT